MTKNMGTGLALVIALVLLLSVNLLGASLLGGAKIDLTEENLYSLSGGSKKMLGKLDDDVKLKLFYSRRAASTTPAIKQYADRVIELLKQFASQSDGGVQLEILEPRPDSEQEEWAIKYGLRGQQLRSTSEPLFFGLVAVSETGQEGSLPFLDPQREGYLEYDIARLVSYVSHPERPKVGIMSALGVMGSSADDPMARMQGRQPTPPWALLSEFRKSYDVEEVPATASVIDESIDVLLVIHPKNFSDQALYAIDQFVVGGGRAVIMPDPHSEFEARNFNSPNPQQRFQENFDSNPEKLLAAWGLEMAKNKVIADKGKAAKVNFGPNGVVDYLVFQMFDGANCNQDELISSDLEQLLFGSAGSLHITEKKPGLTYTPILETESSAMEMDSFMLKFGPNPDQLIKDYIPGSERLTVAWKLQGKFQTAFPGGKPASTLPKPPGEEEEPEPDRPHVAQGTEESSVLVVADSDYVSDDFAVQIQNFFGQRMVFVRFDNLNLLSNTVEQFSGSEDLISLRTRGKSAREFTRVAELEARAANEWRAEEKEQEAKLQELQDEMQRIRDGKGVEGQDGRVVLSAEELKVIEKNNERIAEVKARLREIRRNLRQDIESLGFRLKLINIALLPVFVILLSFLPAAWRSYKMRLNRG